MSKEVIRLPIDMSLRFWSDTIPLKDLTERVSSSVQFSHVPGKLMSERGVLSKRTAARYYVSLTSERTNDNDGVSKWINQIIFKLKSEAEILELIKNGKIECVIWIAILACDRAPLINIKSDVLDFSSLIGFGILLEDYNNIDSNGESPKKIWLSKCASEKT